MIPGWSSHLEAASPPGDTRQPLLLFLVVARVNEMLWAPSGQSPATLLSSAVDDSLIPTTNEQPDPQISLLPRVRSPQLEVPAAGQGRAPGEKGPAAERCGHLSALHGIGWCPLPRVSSETPGHVLSPEEDGLPSAACLDGVWAGQRLPEGAGGEAPGHPFHQVLIALRTLRGPV